MSQECTVETTWGRADVLECLRAAGDDPTHVDLWNAYRQQNPNWQPDLSNLTEPVDLSGLSIGTDSTGSGIDLRRANLSGADLRDSKLASANLVGADLTDANLDGAQIERADLRSAFLIGADLRGAKLNSANLTNANLTGADLTGADLSETSMPGAELWGANLSDAQIWGADLSRAKLTSANLSRAKLRSANISQASLEDANLTGADLAFANIISTELSHANLTDARVGGVRYDRSKMAGKCRGIRISNCYGNALFKRDAEDQDFIDTFKAKVLDDLQRRGHKRPIGKIRWRVSLNRDRRWRYAWIKLLKLERYVTTQTAPLALRAWGWIDYGRSMARVAIIAFLLAFGFGLVYLLSDVACQGQGMIAYPSHEALRWWFTPFYFSIVTYTTLGFGDVTPRNHIGQITVTAEVMLGYVTLGMMLSVLANKVARRA